MKKFSKVFWYEITLPTLVASVVPILLINYGYTELNKFVDKIINLPTEIIYLVLLAYLALFFFKDKNLTCKQVYKKVSDSIFKYTLSFGVIFIVTFFNIEKIDFKSMLLLLFMLSIYVLAAYIVLSLIKTMKTIRRLSDKIFFIVITLVSMGFSYNWKNDNYSAVIFLFWVIVFYARYRFTVRA